jgi:hypothetical protein
VGSFFSFFASGCGTFEGTPGCKKIRPLELLKPIDK